MKIKTTTVTCEMCGRKGRTKRGDLPPGWDLLRLDLGWKIRILCPACVEAIIAHIDGTMELQRMRLSDEPSAA